MHGDVIKRNISRVTGLLGGNLSVTGHIGQWRGALFSLICVAWTEGWANNRNVWDLRRHRAHYDVIAMIVSRHWDGMGNLNSFSKNTDVRIPSIAIDHIDQNISVSAREWLRPKDKSWTKQIMTNDWWDPTYHLIKCLWQFRFLHSMKLRKFFKLLSALLLPS